MRQVLELESGAGIGLAFSAAAVAGASDALHRAPAYQAPAEAAAAAALASWVIQSICEEAVDCIRGWFGGMLSQQVVEAEKRHPGPAAPRPGNSTVAVCRQL